MQSLAARSTTVRSPGLRTDDRSRTFALQELFAELDHLQIESALSRFGGDVNKTVDFLLVINDTATLMKNRVGTPTKSLKASSDGKQAGSATSEADLSEGQHIFPALPWELFVEIMSFLGKKELCALRSLNSTWRDNIDQDEIWMDLTKRQFGHKELMTNFSTWKDMFVDIDRLRFSSVSRSEKIELTNNDRTAKDACKGDEKYRWVTALTHNTFSAGQHYCEIMIDSCCDNSKNTIKIGFGVVDKCSMLTHNCPFGYSHGNYTTQDHNSWVYLADGRIMARNKFTGFTGNAWAKNDRIGVLMDFFSERIYFYWNSRPQGPPLPMQCPRVSVAVSLIGGNQVSLTSSTIHSIMPLP